MRSTLSPPGILVGRTGDHPGQRRSPRGQRHQRFAGKSAPLERGFGTCVQVSIAGYPEIVREHLNMPQEYAILSGLAIGYSDPTFPANNRRKGRNPIEHNVVFHDA
jgi:hypothetical protein